VTAGVSRCPCQAWNGSWPSIMAASCALRSLYLERSACVAEWLYHVCGVRDTPLSSRLFVVLPAYCTRS
jgi:hypothetical protein